MSWKNIIHIVENIPKKEHEIINDDLKKVLKAARQFGKLMFFFCGNSAYNISDPITVYLQNYTL